VLAQDLPPSHPTVQTWSVFSQCHPPKTVFTIDVLDHFYMDAMEMQGCGFELFPKAEKVHK